jgi:transposase-like protein
MYNLNFRSIKMKTEKRKHSAEFKVKILREHLEQQIPIGKICEQYNLHPNLVYLWKKELFSGALEFFSKRKNNREDEKISRLEEKLKDKDSLISEIVEDNLRLKKSMNGDY